MDGWVNNKMTQDRTFAQIASAISKVCLRNDSLQRVELITKKCKKLDEKSFKKYQVK